VQLIQSGTAFLKSLEQLRLVSYRDQAGVWTISWGVTGPHVVGGMRITLDQAEALFREALAPVEAAVNAALKVAVNQNEYTALVCFVYNVGAHKFLHGGPFEGPCTLLADLNNGDRARAADEFDRWVHYEDKQTGYSLISEGLVRRREKEKALFLTPVG
jgi:lysozyme